MSCCPTSSWPALAAPADYTPKGTENELDNALPIYEVGDLSAGKSCIIVLPEVFCWEGRLKGICDHYAEQGYYVIMPDIMRGDSINNHTAETKPDYFKKWGTWVNSESDMQTIFKYLETNGITTIGAIGFCWGAWIIFRASASGMPIKAGACCHPSIRLEGYSGGSPEELSTRIQCPMLFASAGNDPDNVKEGGECSNIILEKFPTSDVKSYPDMEHGWVSRGDQSNENVARDVKAAIEQCDNFFKNNL